MSVKCRVCKCCIGCAVGGSLCPSCVMMSKCCSVLCACSVVVAFLAAWVSVL